MKLIIRGLAAIACSGCFLVPAVAQEPANDEQKTLYTLGVAISQSLGISG